jgi:hypothetical protein
MQRSKLNLPLRVVRDKKPAPSGAAFLAVAGAYFDLARKYNHDLTGERMMLLPND